MFSIRLAQVQDLEDLYDLAKLQVFINLPLDKKVLKDKIESSIRSFQAPSLKLEDNSYIFVLEAFESQKVVGVSMIHGKHGTEDSSPFFFKGFPGA